MSAELILDFALMIGLLVAIIALVYWLSWRSKKRKQDHHASALHELARQHNGTVTVKGHGATAPRSAALRPAFNGRDRASLVDKAITMSPPRYHLALDMWRGRWLVRVAEASYERANSGGSKLTHHEYTIEIAVQATPPLKFAPILTNEFGRFAGAQRHNKRLVPENQLQQPAAALNPQQQGLWRQVPVQTPHGQHFMAFSADDRFTAAVLNTDSVGWLAQHSAQLSDLIAIEGGLLYTARGDQLDPQTLLPSIDLLIGFLERTPVQPGDLHSAR